MSFKFLRLRHKSAGRQNSPRTENQLLATAGTALVSALLFPALGSTIGYSQTAEYNANAWQYNAIGLDKAIAKGIFGNGVVIGIADSAMQIGNGTNIAPHPEFVGRIAPYNFPTPFDVPAGLPHGTNVGSVVGGARDGVGMHGVAPGTILSSMRVIQDGTAANPLGPPAPNNATPDSYAGAIAAGIRLFNNSYGTSANVSALTLEQVTQRFDIETYRNAVNAGAVLVWASGNDDTAYSDGEPGLPFHIRDLEKGWVSVISVSRTLAKSDGMSACGFAAQWCMAAPGEDVNMAAPTGGEGAPYATATGTSYSAPMVTGAIALAKQMFPNASMQQLRVLVLQTATDLGAPGVDAVFGWGLLNIGNLVNSTNPANGAVVTNTTVGQAAAVNTVVNTVANRLAEARNSGASSAPTETAQVAPESSNQIAALLASTRMSLGGPLDRMAAEQILTERAGAPVGALAWGRGIAGQTVVDDTSTTPGARVNTAGAIGGYEARFAPEWSGGAAFGFTYSDLNTDGTPDTSNARGFHGILTASWTNNGWFADAVANVSWFDTDFTRTPLAAAGAVLAQQQGQLDADTWGFGSNLKVGRTYRFASATLEPYIHASWTHLRNDSGIETGTGIFAISLQSGDFSTYQGGVGIRAQLATVSASGLLIVPVADFAYGVMGGDNAASATFEMLGTPIVSDSAKFGRNVLNVGANLNISAPGSVVSGYVGYNGMLQKDVRDQTVSGGLTIRF